MIYFNTFSYKAIKRNNRMSFKCNSICYISMWHTKQGNNNCISTADTQSDKFYDSPLTKFIYFMVVNHNDTVEN